jgi:hypothetical protein
MTESEKFIEEAERKVHLDACKKQALMMLALGDRTQAFKVFVEMMAHRPDTKIGDGLGVLGAAYLVRQEDHLLQSWIEGFR